MLNGKYLIVELLFMTIEFSLIIVKPPFANCQIPTYNSRIATYN